MTKLYTLEVLLIDGFLTEEFFDKEISRTLQIRGDQTLETLHYAIFDAFDREDDHMYDFNLGEGPYDFSARYVLPVLEDDEGVLGVVTETTIDDLQLEVGRAFGYLFDFGDNWLHQINVIIVGDSPTSGEFPKIIKRVGKSPPQYPEV